MIARFQTGLLLIYLLIQPLAAMNHSSEHAVEFTVRHGLPNWFQKLEAGTGVKIAYLGGSITAQSGWRVFSQEWFEQQYPQAKINGIPAAIGGTGSGLGVFRLEKDVLHYEPDLLFVEFAVNDAHASPENIIKSMEGIVRKTWTSNPEIDICFVYTLTFRESPQLAAGKVKRSVEAMEVVAEHYGIPSIHMGYHIALMEKEGSLVMKTSQPMTRVSGDELNQAAEMPKTPDGRIIFSKDGVHPYPETGHVLYTQALIRAMEDIRQKQTHLQKHQLIPPIKEDNWESAKLVNIPKSAFSGPYIDLSKTDEPIAQRFKQSMHPMYRLKPGASLRLKFKGSKISIYDLLGPDGGMLQITLDGKQSYKKRFDAYSTYHRLSTLSIGDQLDDGIHELSIRVLDDTFDKAKILFEKNRKNIEEFPEKYADYLWHIGPVLILGELIE